MRKPKKLLSFLMAFTMTISTFTGVSQNVRAEEVTNDTSVFAAEILDYTTNSARLAFFQTGEAKTYTINRTAANNEDSKSIEVNIEDMDTIQIKNNNYNEIYTNNFTASDSKDGFARQDKNPVLNLVTDTATNALTDSGNVLEAKAATTGNTRFIISDTFTVGDKACFDADFRLEAGGEAAQRTSFGIGSGSGADGSAKLAYIFDLSIPGGTSITDVQAKGVAVSDSTGFAGKKEEGMSGRANTGWLHLHASFEKSSTNQLSVEITRVATNKVLYQQTIDIGTSVPNCFGITPARSGAARVYVDNLLVTNGEDKTLTKYIYTDTNLKEDSDYTYTISDKTSSSEPTVTSGPVTVHTAYTVKDVTVSDNVKIDDIIQDTPLENDLAAYLKAKYSDISTLNGVTAVNGSGEQVTPPISSWNVEGVDMTKAGTYTVHATIAGWSTPIPVSLTVVGKKITDYSVDNISIPAGKTYELPNAIMASFDNGQTDLSVPVTWDASAVLGNKAGEYTVTGSCAYESEKQIAMKVIVTADTVTDSWLYYEYETCDEITVEDLPHDSNVTWASGKSEVLPIEWKNMQEISTGEAMEWSAPYTIKPVTADDRDVEINTDEEHMANFSIKYPTVKRFDFGSTKSDVADGWYSVNYNADKMSESYIKLGCLYDAAKGYGITDVDEEATDSKARTSGLAGLKGYLPQAVYADMALIGAGTGFQVDIPNGTYEVTVIAAPYLGLSGAEGTVNGQAFNVSASKTSYTETAVDAVVTEQTLKFAFTAKTSYIAGIIIRAKDENPAPAGISFSKNTLKLAVGDKKTLSYSLVPKNASLDGVAISFESSDPAVATVDNNGTVAAVAEGKADITVKATVDAKTYTALCTITVGAATGDDTEVTGLTVTPKTATIEAGKTQQFTATVEPENASDKSVTWSSDKPEVASVDENGLVTAIAVGTATITAKAGEKTASATVTVVAVGTTVEVSSITLTPKTAEMKIGDKEQLTAVVAPEDATNKSVTWTVDKPDVATVDTKGLVTAKKAGTAVITAKAGDKTDTATITVKASETDVPVESITLDKTEASIKTGETVTLTPTVLPEKADQTVTWTSSDPAIAAVENGVVTGVAKGEATITAKAGEKTATAKITVTETSGDTVPVESITLDKTEATLTAAGQTVTLTATVLPEKADQTVTWTSSDPTKATVENGVVTAVANGTATITATAVNGMHAAALVTVAIGDSGNVTDTKVSAITVTAADNKTTLTKAGETVQLTAAVLPAEAKDKSVTWASSNPAAAAVSETGLVTAAANGTAVISATAKDGSNVKGDLTITVNIPAPEETVGGAVGSKVTPASKTEKGSYKVTVQGTAGKAAEVAFTGTKETGKKIIIPNTVKGTDGVTYQVTKITKSAISANQKKKITEVKIPDNVKTIEAGAFTNCTKLTKVTFTKKSKLTKIDANTFKGCKEIKTFTIPGSVTKIGKSAFEKCTALKKIVIPDKVTEIGDKAFYGNKKMTDVTIGKKVTKIGKQAFYGCKLLKKVKVNTTKLKTVGKNAFKGVKKGAQAKVPAKQKKAYKNLLKPLKVK